MKHKLSAIFALVVMTVALAPSGAQAQVVAPGPYYATPSWDQTLPVATRFIVLSNMASKAVLDRETGLVWEQSPSAFVRSWFDASSNCYSSLTGGREGWRLPTVQDLTSLKVNGQLPIGHPFGNVQDAYYWTATSSALNTSSALLVGPLGGDTARDVKTSANYYAWCVRGGHGSDAQ